MIPLNKTRSMKVDQDCWEEDDEFSFVELN
jgi:hypothetical protein